jgi:putrescine importer
VTALAGTSRMSDPTQTPSAGTPGPLRLRRVLGLWDLVFFGIILIQPIPSLGQFGIGSRLSHGHMVPALLVAMLAMLLTAISYGRLSAMFPSAGSAYTYVGRGLNPYLGFLVGWAMFLGYLVVPLVNTVYAAVTCQRLFPHTPYTAWVVLFATGITLLNLRGIRAAARFNIAMLVVMCAVVLVYIVQAIRFLLGAQGWPGLFSLAPFYDPRTFDFGAIRSATAFVALTYIGVDGVTTLAEDVRNPKRNVMLATILVCVFTGLFSGFQIYLAQRVWPDYRTFTNLETAIFDVCQRVGGPALFTALAVTLFIASLGSGMAGQASGARLLYGMGRDGVLPKRLFGLLDSKRNCPVANVWLIGVVTIAAALLLDYERSGKLLVFGSFLAFVWVNVAAIAVFYVRAPRSERSLLRDALPPALGLLFCLGIWGGLERATMIRGGVWMLAGAVYLGIMTGGFRRPPPQIDFSEG